MNGSVDRNKSIARNLVEAGNGGPRPKGLPTCVSRGRRDQPERRSPIAASTSSSAFSVRCSRRSRSTSPRKWCASTRPGGRIVMGNWIPNDPTLVAQILKISSAYSPPPPEGFVSPMTWGVESHVIERFGAAGIPRRADRIRQGHVHVQLRRFALGVRRGLPGLLRADDERVRRRGDRMARPRSCSGSSKRCSSSRTRARSRAARPFPATFLRVTVTV